ncbi:MAG: ABC transporter substrate-binding protein [Armatimonadetes bacterium]|nr:ABC transporter substrate-binding protein [Armatimonadota bacterium]MDW8154661.1 ABC transporter substrate-binding protein [Armatimonadota bacterium]
MRCLAVFLLVVGLAGLLGRATAQERGVTPEEVVIGTSMPLSGPAAYWGAVGRGMEAYARYLSEQGGIHGRRLRVVVRDDGYLPPRAAANVRELVERVGVFAIVGLIGSANAFAVRDYLVRNQVLWITPTADATMWYGFRQKRYLFVTYPSYVEEARILVEYAAERLGVRTVAVFYQNDLYGQKGLLGAKQGAHKARIRIVAQVPYEVTAAEVSTEAVKLRESRAEAVLLYATPRHGALIVREMAKVGYAPRLLSSFTLGDPIMFTLAGEAWNNVISTGFFPLPGTGDARVDQALSILTRIDPALRANPYNALAGWAFLEPLVEALRRAGRELTQERVVSALESLRNWDGEVIRGVTFGPDRRQGIHRIFLTRAEGGRYVRISDWISYPVRF